jgi:hypothetical protein
MFRGFSLPGGSAGVVLGLGCPLFFSFFLFLLVCFSLVRGFVLWSPPGRNWLGGAVVFYPSAMNFTFICFKKKKKNLDRPSRQSTMGKELL